jgi:hypothetical protein
MSRYVLQLVHKTDDGRWHLEHEGSSLASFETKAQAERDGQARGAQLWIEGRPAQLVVHREDGSIEHEYTYGKDPERHRG